MNHLDELEMWVTDGTLSQIVERQKLGNALTEAQRALREGSRALELLRNALLAADCAQNLDADADVLLSSGGSLAAATSPQALDEWRRVEWPLVQKTAPRIDAALRKAWLDRCSREFVTFGLLAEVLNRISSMRKLAKEMAELAKTGQAIGADYPPTQKVRDRLSVAQDAVARLQDRLKSSGVSPAVVEFLVTVLQQGVRLADLPEEVHEWLGQNQALGAFEVRLAPDGTPRR